MKTEKGKKAMRRLVETSDVLIHNIRPDAIDRLKLALRMCVRLGQISCMFTVQVWTRRPVCRSAGL